MKINWLEIPVKDIQRAQKFYETVFGLKEKEIVDDGVRRILTLHDPDEESPVGVSLNQTHNFEPGQNGPLAYIYTGPDLIAELSRVEKAGGKIIKPKTRMGESDGFYYAMLQDTEGNVLALSAY